MAKSTGIILAVGGITLANQVIFNDEEMNWRIPIATGIAAVMFTGIEKANEQAAVGLAYLALVAVVFTRVVPGIPSPTESALKWWNTPAKSTSGKKASAVTPASQRVMQV